MIKNKLESLKSSKFAAFKMSSFGGGKSDNIKKQKIQLNDPILTDRYTDKCHEYDAFDGDTNPGRISGTDWWWVDSWSDIADSGF